jgi:hypothetical protein
LVVTTVRSGSDHVEWRLGFSAETHGQPVRISGRQRTGDPGDLWRLREFMGRTPLNPAAMMVSADTLDEHDGDGLDEHDMGGRGRFRGECFERRHRGPARRAVLYGLGRGRRASMSARERGDDVPGRASRPEPAGGGCGSEAQRFQRVGLRAASGLDRWMTGIETECPSSSRPPQLLGAGSEAAQPAPQR